MFEISIHAPFVDIVVLIAQNLSPASLRFLRTKIVYGRNFPLTQSFLLLPNCRQVRKIDHEEDNDQDAGRAKCKCMIIGVPAIDCGERPLVFEFLPAFRTS
jgi:hypothetical protein